MVLITKLYLILQKKLLFVSVLPIEKARSYRMTLGITEVILTGFTSSMHEVKSTDMHCTLTTNINKCHGEKMTRTKECQIFPLVMYSRYQSGISPECGLEVGQTL